MEDTPGIVSSPQEVQEETDTLSGIDSQFNRANEKFGGKLFVQFSKRLEDGSYSVSDFFDSHMVPEGENTESYLVFSNMDGFRKISADRPANPAYPADNNAEALKGAIEELRGQKRFIGDVSGDHSPGHNTNPDGRSVFVLPFGVIAKSGDPDARFRYEAAPREFVEKALKENAMVAKEEAADVKRKQEEERNSALGIAKEIAANLPNLLNNQ